MDGVRYRARGRLPRTGSATAHGGDHSGRAQLQLRNRPKFRFAQLKLSPTVKIEPTVLRCENSADRNQLHVLDHRDQIIICDRFLCVAEGDDAAIDLVELEAGVADGLAAVLHRVTA